MLKYVFAAVFIALAWGAVLVFSDALPVWPAVVASVAIVGALVAQIVYRLVASKRAASAIERGLRDETRRQSDGMRPDLQAEIQAMQAEFQKAVASLKASKLGRSGRDALGVLPWYVMIGPSASGKTTAIRSSGLKLPYGKTGKVRGVGGTRNCDWWMTNEAILLDTAGRWSTQEDDRDEWLAFLDLLKQTRPKKPINGILLAVPVTDLQKTEDEIAELAHTLRERIDEVIGRLEIVVPIYVIVTKCDLVSGFVETFGDLKDRDRGQIWGFSFPLVNDGIDHVDAFAQQFDDLAEVLERNALVRMGEERRIEARDHIYAFPQQFDTLRQGLIDLVANLFSQSVYQDGPIMRGVFFTSGTQEGRPIDRIMDSMASALGVRARMPSPPSAKPKSYFVRDVFQRVVFPDQDVAVRSGRVLRREQRVRWAIAGGALLASAALLVVPISSYLSNKRFISDVETFVAKLAYAREQHSPGSPLSSRALESAEAMADRLAKVAADGPDVGLQVAGLYPGERLLDPVQLAIEQLVVRPVLEFDADRLMAFSRGQSDVDAAGATAGLMLHLLLTQAKAPDEPSPEGDAWRTTWVPIAATKASDRWAAMAGDTASSHARHTVESVVRFFALRVGASGELVERKPNLVSRVRTVLVGTNDGDPLADLLRDPNMPRDVRLIDVVGGAIGAFQNSGDVRRKGLAVSGAFTPTGWKIAKGRITRLSTSHQRDENSWVLGAIPRKSDPVDPAALQAGYFRRYVDDWKAFLLSLSIVEPTNIEEVRRLLKSLVMDKPLEALWRNANKYLVFKDDTPAGAAIAKAKSGLSKRANDLKKKLLGDEPAGADNAPAEGQAGVRAGGNEEPTAPDDVGREFASFLKFGVGKGTGLETYSKAVSELSTAIGELGTPEPKEFQGVMRRLRASLTQLISEYNDGGWEGPLLEKMLMPPFRGTEVAVIGATSGSANRKWCDNVVVVYDQLLAGRYPLATSKGARDVHVADLEKFFQPKSGVLWQYFGESLQSDFDHPSGTTVFREKDQTSVKYKQNLASFLRRAQELTDVLYSRDPAKLGLTVSLRIRASAPYNKIVFEMGGRKVTYFNTKERWEDLTWPARGALFRFYQKSGEGEIGYPDGEWALFHLLESGKFTAASEGEEYLAGTWLPPLSEGPIRADVKPAVLLRAFRGMDLPRNIVVGASGCGH